MVGYNGRKRSQWKPLFSSVTSSLANNYKLVTDRAAIILPKHIGFFFKVHSGKNSVKINVTSEMVGFKFGEFTLTTKMGPTIHLGKNKKNKGKKKK